MSCCHFRGLFPLVSIFVSGELLERDLLLWRLSADRERLLLLSLLIERFLRLFRGLLDLFLSRDSLDIDFCRFLLRDLDRRRLSYLSTLEDLSRPIINLIKLRW